MQPPYYAVIFTSIKRNESEEYNKMAVQMEELVQKQKGYLGHESARNDIGITVSYWATLDDIQNWKNNAEHKIAQEMGYNKFYSYYKTRICKVEREYDSTKVK